MSNYNINEGSSGKYTGTLTDENGNAIELADIDAVALTLFLPETDENTIVNSRDGQDVLNKNNVTIHATSGLMTWEIQAADTAITDTGREDPYEIHRALFEFTYQTTKKGKHTVDLYVKNLRKVP